jgi:hypothetical protein
MDTPFPSDTDEGATHAHSVPPFSTALRGFQGLPCDVPALNELREHHRWVAWKYVPNPKKAKPDKVPFSAHTGAKADTTDPKSWATYAEAEAFAISHGMDGVGFCLGEDCVFAAYDLDDCYNPGTGEFAPWAQDVIDLGETYAEYSPSGTGMRLFSLTIPEKTETYRPAGVEVYRKLRYLTVTGNHIEGTPREIRGSPKTERLLLDRIKAVRAEVNAAKAVKDRQGLSARAKPSTDTPRSFAPDEGADADAVLTILPNDYDDHAEWIKIGMSFYAAGGSFEVWDRWCQKHCSYDQERTLAAWRSFVRGGVREITAATLFGEVLKRVPDWKRPSQSNRKAERRQPAPTPAPAEEQVERKPGGGKFALNTYAFKHLELWVPQVAPEAERLPNGHYKITVDQNGEKLPHRIYISNSDIDDGSRAILNPIKLVARLFGMSDSDAADTLADLVGFELELDENAALRTKFEAKQERKARMNKVYEDAKGGRVTIQYHARSFTAAAEQSEKAILRRNKDVLVRGGALVRPVVSTAEGADGKPTNVVELKEITLPYMKSLMDGVAVYEKPRSGDGRPEWVPTFPPREVAELILDRVGHWPFPPVVGVIACPTLRPDGSLLSMAGYDPVTRLYLMGGVDLPSLPETPTKADAEASLARLNALLDDFPFVDEGSRSVALSALIAPVLRGMLPRAPIHAITAPTAGTGKSFLLDLGSIVATGFPCAVQSVGRDDAETEKRLVGSILAGRPIICLDNINAVFGSDFLCQIATQARVEVRPLGGSDKVDVEPRMTIFANGNNMVLTGDLTRRAIVARLDAAVEDPHKRQFKGDPAGDIMRDRGRYVADAITIVRAYIAAGRPGKLPKLASFDAWSDNVRSALVWLGCADPCDTMERVRDDDPERAKAVAFFEAWKKELGTEGEYKAKDLIEAATTALEDHDCPLLREAITAIAWRRGQMDAQALGIWLDRHRDRVISGLQLTHGQITGGSRRWLMRQAKRGT